MTIEPGKPRIAIYGVGQYGAHIARFAVHKGWPIVAAFNRAGPKVGRDLGRVIGLDQDLGVPVQDCESADYGALMGKADIGIVAQTNSLRLNLPAYRRLLGAGLNVGCHGSESYLPASSDPEAAREIDALARAHHVTFTGSGIWDMSRIWSGLLLTGPCTEIVALHHRSVTDAQGQVNSFQQAQQLGIGGTVEAFYALKIDRSPAPVSYKTISEHVLQSLGCSVRETSIVIEPIVFDEPVATWLLPEGRFEPGTVVGLRALLATSTVQGVTAKATIEIRMLRPNEVEHMFWEVDGKPRTRVRVERDDPAHATAASLFNRIPDIIAAPPGIVLVSQLGPLKTTATW